MVLLKLIIGLAIIMCNPKGAFNSELHVENGVIKITKNIKCNFENNGNKFNGTGPGDINGYYFGLITYACDNLKGILVSKLSCKTCGLYCNYNQLIEGCEDFWVPFIIGVVVSIVVLGMFIPFIQKRVYKLIIYITEEIMFLITRCKDKRELRNINKLAKRNVTGLVPRFSRPINKNGKFIEKINRKRDMNSYVEIQMGQLDNDYNIQEEPELSISNEINEHTPSAPRRYPSLTSVKAATIGILALSSLPPVIDCCDNTLYITSNGQICTKTECIDSRMYDMPLMTGSVTCFQDNDGNVMKLKIDDAYWRNRYALVYYTSDVRIDVDYMWNCRGAGLCMEGNCNKNSTNPKLVKKGKIGDVEGHGCYTGVSGCDTYCYHGITCTWYRWMINSVGSRYPVYQAISELWELVISVDYKGVISRYTANVNNPRINLDGMFSTMPMFVTGFTSTKEIVSSGIVVIDNHAIETKVSDLNMPEADIIGDFQIDLVNSSYVYNEHMVSCQIDSCKPICTIPEPKIRRIKRKADFEHSVLYTQVGGRYLIETQKKVNGLVKIMIGNIDLNNLKVEPARCEVALVTTYSCSGCKTIPYAVFQANNIITEGIVPITSNCSLSTKYVSCSSDPYKIEFESDSKYCSIHIPTLNKTLNIGFEFIFKGQLDPTSSIYATETTEQVIKSIMTTPSFYQGILGTVSTITLLSIGSSLVCRLIKIWQFNKFARDQVNK